MRPVRVREGDGFPARRQKGAGGVRGAGPHTGSHRHTHTGLGRAVTEVISPNLICSLGAALNITQVLAHLILTATFSKRVNITPDFTNEETEAHRLARCSRTRI